MSKIDHPQRFHDLDARRAFAMLLGILYHLSLSFGEFYGHYQPVQDRSAHHLFDLFALATPLPTPRGSLNRYQHRGLKGAWVSLGPAEAVVVSGEPEGGLGWSRRSIEAT